MNVHQTAKPTLKLVGIHNEDDSVLRLKPVVRKMLRIQSSWGMLNTSVSMMRRAKHALQLASKEPPRLEFIPLMRIAVASIGLEASSLKLALLTSEEAIREAYEYSRSLEVDSALAKAASLILKEYEEDRFEAIMVMNEVRTLCRPLDQLAS